MKKVGQLIVIEGVDGAGKATQTKLLVEELQKNNVPTKAIDFPRYDDNFFGKLIQQSQQGIYGSWTNLDPHLTSVFYAADRFESSQTIKDWLRNGYTVIADRYATANQIHQGGKISHADERTVFIEWLAKLEYEVFKISKPNLVIYLDVPLAASQANLAKKHKGQPTTDQTESDPQYTANAQKTAFQLARDNDWRVVNCAPNGQLRTIEDIHNEVYTIVINFLHAN